MNTRCHRWAGVGLAVLAAGCAGDTGPGSLGDSCAALDCPPADGPICADVDGDGYGNACGPEPDCDDGDADVNPGATEACNGIDDTCEGTVDEGCPWVKHAAARGDPVLVAALPDGSILISGGYSAGPPTFGAGEPAETTLPCDPHPACSGFFLAKYTPWGALVWARQIAAGVDHVYDIAALPDGSSAITGRFAGTITFGPGEKNETSFTEGPGTLRDIFVARYDADGTLLWARRAGGPGSNSGTGVAALADGGVLVTGSFVSGATFGAGEPGEVTFTGGGTRDAFLAKFDSSGTLAWVKRAGGTGADAGGRVAALGDGSSLVVGTFHETATFGPGEPGEVTLDSIGMLDSFLAKFDPEGALVWVKNAGGVSDDGASAIAALPDGTALVTGMFRWAATFGQGEPAQTTLTSTGGNPDLFVARYGPSGELAWASRAGGMDGFPTASVGIAAQSDGSAFITGLFEYQTTFGAGEAGETTLMGPNGSLEIFVARFDPGGTLAWARQGGHTVNDEWGEGIAVLPDGSPVVTGFIPEGTATFDLGQGILADLSGPGIFIARYTP